MPGTANSDWSIGSLWLVNPGPETLTLDSVEIGGLYGATLLGTATVPRLGMALFAAPGFPTDGSTGEQLDWTRQTPAAGSQVPPNDDQIPPQVIIGLHVGESDAGFENVTVKYHDSKETYDLPIESKVQLAVSGPCQEATTGI
ncbi:hypothetical protein D1871_04015 [Nakamurella silvestris]|nr:hypothetical protein D1871_04015 [Nakamurella silvestris]